MNERIQEIHNRVMAWSDTRGNPDKYEWGMIPENYTKKFAELIVRECANRATWAQDTGESDIGGEVLKHFGVEE